MKCLQHLVLGHALVLFLLPPHSLCQGCTQGQYYLPSTPTLCVACPPGSYCPLSLGCNASCPLCPPNSGSAAGASTCIGPFCQTCPAGFYCSGGTMLQGCPTGTYSSSANLYSSAQCAQCTPGTFTPAVNATVCQACSVGAYASTLATTLCTLCAAGTFLTAQGASACLFCASGTYTTAQGTKANCTPCAPGAFQTAAASTACQLCYAGSYATVAALNNISGCALCPAGDALHFFFFGGGVKARNPQAPFQPPAGSIKRPHAALAPPVSSSHCRAPPYALPVPWEHTPPCRARPSAQGALRRPPLQAPPPAPLPNASATQATRAPRPPALPAFRVLTRRWLAQPPVSSALP